MDPRRDPPQGGFLLSGISGPLSDAATAEQAARERLYRDASAKIFGVFFQSEETTQTTVTRADGAMGTRQTYDRMSTAKLPSSLIRYIEFQEPEFQTQADRKVTCRILGKISAEAVRAVVAENREIIATEAMLRASAAVIAARGAADMRQWYQARTVLTDARIELHRALSYIEDTRLRRVLGDLDAAFSPIERLASVRYVVEVSTLPDVPRDIAAAAVERIRESLVGHEVRVVSTASSEPVLESKIILEGATRNYLSKFEQMYAFRRSVLPVFAPVEARLVLSRPQASLVALSSNGDPTRGSARALDSVDLRRSPSASAAVLGRIDAGESVDLHETKSGYWLISSGREAGWVYGGFLESEKISTRTWRNRTPLYDATGKWTGVVEPGRYVVASQIDRGVWVILPDGREGNMR